MLNFKKLLNYQIPDYVMIAGIGAIMLMILGIAWKVDENSGSCGVGLEKEVNVCVAKSEYVRLKVLETRYQNGN